jgi:hypothetical protein
MQNIICQKPSVFTLLTNGRSAGHLVICHYAIVDTYPYTMLDLDELVVLDFTSMKTVFKVNLPRLRNSYFGPTQQKIRNFWCPISAAVA